MHFEMQKAQHSPAAWRLSRTVAEALEPMISKARERERNAWVDGFVADVLETAEELDSEATFSNDNSPAQSASQLANEVQKSQFGAAWEGANGNTTETQLRSPQPPGPPQGSHHALLQAHGYSRGQMMSQPHRSLSGALEVPYHRNPPPSSGRKALQTRHSDDGEIPDGPIELTDLQRLISEGITMKGSYGTIDDIYTHVAKFWNELRNPNGSSKTTDCRRAIITSLTKNSISATPIFAKGPAENTWVLGRFHPWRSETHMAFNTPISTAVLGINSSGGSETTSADSSSVTTPISVSSDTVDAHVLSPMRPSLAPIVPDYSTPPFLMAPQRPPYFGFPTGPYGPAVYFGVAPNPTSVEGQQHLPFMAQRPPMAPYSITSLMN